MTHQSHRRYKTLPLKQPWLNNVYAIYRHLCTTIIYGTSTYLNWQDIQQFAAIFPLSLKAGGWEISTNVCVYVCMAGNYIFALAMCLLWHTNKEQWISLCPSYLYILLCLWVSSSFFVFSLLPLSSLALLSLLPVPSSIQGQCVLVQNLGRCLLIQVTQFYNEESANFRIYIQLSVSGCSHSLFLVSNPSGDLNLWPRVSLCVHDRERAR